MAEQLTWTAMVRVDGGPQITDGGSIDIEGYDKLSVAVAAKDSRRVDLGPAAAGTVACLVIKPTPRSALLKCEAGGTTIKLDQPLFLLGGGVDLTGNATRLQIANGSEVDAVVEILVGRAVPEKKAAPAKAAPAKKAPAKKGGG